MADYQKWVGYNNYDHFFEFSQLTLFLEEISNTPIPLIKVGKKEYLNIPVTLDIETSSTYVKGKKFATMYLWGFGFNGSVIVGRTWDQLKKLISQLTTGLELSKNRIMTIYIHNLGYEFQWIRKRIKWLKTPDDKDDVFAMKERRPIYAKALGIEFKCSYFLSNYSLAYIGAELLHKYPVEKAVGDLDYSLVRHCETPLTTTELWYQVKDCQVVMSYIQEKIEQDGDIVSIPLTNTGYVRKYCRNWCFTGGADNPDEIKKIRAKYHQQMKSLSIKSECEHDQLKAAFGGGFTHAAAKYSGKTIKNVGSADESSAYPGTMVCDYYPATSSKYIGEVTLKELQFYLKYYCCLFTVTLHDVTPSFIYENYISLSHCSDISDDYVSNNGRVASASQLTTTITELDWDIIVKAYSCDWSATVISSLRIYQRDYLPKPMILSILNLYGDKTSLKGVEGKEVEYMVSKNMINAAFGMAVTAIVREAIDYVDDEWTTDEGDKRKQIVDYNKNYNRFLYYPWGVWVTAHARHNLWEAIFEFGADYVYSDTDSIKGLNFENHMEFFKKYNDNIKIKLMKMCSYYKIPYSMCKPKTKKGDEKLIGVWDFEPSYTTFRTIGAKRYMYEHEDGIINITVSGVNKHYGTPYLLHKYSNLNDDSYYDLFRTAYSADTRIASESALALKQISQLRLSGKLDYTEIFNHFNEGLYFPPKATGKNTITYIDKTSCANIVDYLGNSAFCWELSSVHMEPQDYSLSRTAEYLNFIRGFSDASI